MKPNSLLIFAVVSSFAVCVSAQRFLTNQVNSAQATKAAAHLKPGMTDHDADSILRTNGITGGFTVGGTAGGTRFYFLSDSCSLALDVTLNPHGWTNQILRAAHIQSNGINIASISLTNRP